MTITLSFAVIIKTILFVWLSFMYAKTVFAIYAKSKASLKAKEEYCSA